VQTLTATNTLERLREAALELFGDRGYDGASMAELAERVGIAKPSLYNYFRSKEELLIDLVEAGAKEWRDRCMEPFTRRGTFERQLGEHLRRVVEFNRERPHVVAVFHMAIHHVHGDLAERVRALSDQIEAEITTDVRGPIEEAIASGELDAADPEDVRLFLGIFFHGLMFQQTSCPGLMVLPPERFAAVWRALYRAVSGRLPERSPAP